MTHPFDELSAEALRARRSEKWRAFPPDVLPVWVAETDFPLADPIVRTLIELAERGDTGYAHPGRLPETYAAFARTRYGVDVDPSTMYVVQDIMRGILAT